MSSTQPVQIIARVRPPLKDELCDDAIHVLPIPSSHSLAAARPIPFTAWVSISSTGTTTTTQVQTKDSQTAFHAAFSPDTTQLQLFNEAVSPHLPLLLRGHTLTILAYGPTSSGKTHTMEGSKEEPGLIPRSVRVLFEMIEKGKGSEISSAAVHMSYLELYRDDAFDLLVSQKAPHEKLAIRTNAKGDTFVVGLTRVPIRSFAEWERVFRTASQNRTTGATLLNRASSRSHAMLTIEIEIVAPPTSTTREMTYNGKMNLVDLAGSENNKHTGNSLANPTRLAESAAINKSLSTLGQVVHALNTGASRIPYRDSNLTRLLSSSLGGKASGKTILLCNLAPGVKFRSDVLNTLNFASRTKNIETKTVVNERERPQEVREEIVVAKIEPLAIKKGRRSSLIPAPSSRIPSYGSRLSGIHAQLGTVGAGPLGSAAGFGTGVLGGSQIGKGIADADLDERINRAVEAEVRRRLEEHKRLEQEKQAKEARELEGQSRSSNTTNSSASSSSLISYSTSSNATSIINASGTSAAQPVDAKMEATAGLHIEEAMDVDRVGPASSPMKIDVVPVVVPNSSVSGERISAEEAPGADTQPADSERDDGAQHEDEDDLRDRLEELERKYATHVAQLEEQLAAINANAAMSTSASSSTSSFSTPAFPSSTHLSASTSSTISRDLGSFTPNIDSALTDGPALEALSPVSRKKTGRLCVALARAHSDKNNLPTALALYRRAALFVPDNVKLRERIIDVEWAVNNGKSFVPSPKRNHEAKSSKEGRHKKSSKHSTEKDDGKAKRATSRSHAQEDDIDENHGDDDEDMNEVENALHRAGTDSDASDAKPPTSTRSRSSKRKRTAVSSAKAAFGTELKNIREEGDSDDDYRPGNNDDSEDEYRPSPKKSKSQKSNSTPARRVRTPAEHKTPSRLSASRKRGHDDAFKQNEIGRGMGMDDVQEIENMHPMESISAFGTPASKVDVTKTKKVYSYGSDEEVLAAPAKRKKRLN